MLIFVGMKLQCCNKIIATEETKVSEHVIVSRRAKHADTNQTQCSSQVSCPTKLTVALADGVHLLLLIDLHSGTQISIEPDHSSPSVEHGTPNQRKINVLRERDTSRRMRVAFGGACRRRTWIRWSRSPSPAVLWSPFPPSVASPWIREKRIYGDGCRSLWIGQDRGMPLVVPPCTDEQYC